MTRERDDTEGLAGRGARGGRIAASSQVLPLADSSLGALVAAGILLGLYSFFYDRWKLPPQVVEYGTFGRTIAGDVVPMLLLPILFARFALRIPLRDLGWRLRPLRRLLGAALLAWLAVLPFVAWLASLPAFQAYYPSIHFPPARAHPIGLAFLWLLHHVPQLLSVECLFRGILFLPLARRFGFELALAAQLALYIALHATKPSLELLLAAYAGAVFSVAAWRTGSFLPAFVAHWLVAVSMDLLCYLHIHGRL